MSEALTKCMPWFYIKIIGERKARMIYLSDVQTLSKLITHVQWWIDWRNKNEIINNIHYRDGSNTIIISSNQEYQLFMAQVKKFAYLYVDLTHKICHFYVRIIGHSRSHRWESTDLATLSDLMNAIQSLIGVQQIQQIYYTIDNDEVIISSDKQYQSFLSLLQFSCILYVNITNNQQMNDPVIQIQNQLQNLKYSPKSSNELDVETKQNVEKDQELANAIQQSELDWMGLDLSARKFQVYHEAVESNSKQENLNGSSSAE